MLVKVTIPILFLIICGFKCYQAQDQQSQKSSFNFNHPPFVDNIPVPVVYDDQETNSGRSVSTTESVATTYHPSHRNLKALLEDFTEQTSTVQTKEGKPKKYSKIIRKKQRGTSDLQIPVVIVYDSVDGAQNPVKENIELTQNKKVASLRTFRGSIKAQKAKTLSIPEGEQISSDKNDKNVTNLNQRENIKKSTVQQNESSTKHTEVKSTESINKFTYPLNLKDNKELDTVTPTTKRTIVQRRRKLTTTSPTPISTLKQIIQNNDSSYDNKEEIDKSTTIVMSSTENIIREQKSKIDYVKPSYMTRIPTIETNEKLRRFRTKDPVVPIVESKNYVYSHSGDFHYSYESGDGTRAFEEGSMNPSESVVGGFSYKDKDGKDITLTYEAGVNGYHPVGSHLPTPPPIPPAIARALKYLATKTTPAYEDVTESL